MSLLTRVVEKNLKIHEPKCFVHKKQSALGTARTHYLKTLALVHKSSMYFGVKYANVGADRWMKGVSLENMPVSTYSFCSRFYGLNLITLTDDNHLVGKMMK
jgi:hypothetical protein